MTYVIAAEEGSHVQIGESACPLEQWSGIEANGLDMVGVAVLQSMLTGDTLQEAMDYCEPVYVSDDGRLVIRLSDLLLERLIDSDEAFCASVANELVATDAFEEGPWDVADVHGQLMALADLARLAYQQQKVLYVWMISVD